MFSLNKNQKWKFIGNFGWDVGMILIGSPENIYKVYLNWAFKKWSKQIKYNGNDFVNYLIGYDMIDSKNKYEKRKEQLCKQGILILDNFGGDGSADVHVCQSLGLDVGIKIVFNDLNCTKKQEIETEILNCSIKWENGMIFIGDPIAITDYINKFPSFYPFLNHYILNFQKFGFYYQFLNEIWLDNLPDKGLFTVKIEREKGDPIDSVITLISK